jgi:hypothetical protein
VGLRIPFLSSRVLWFHVRVVMVGKLKNDVRKMSRDEKSLRCHRSTPATNEDTFDCYCLYVGVGTSIEKVEEAFHVLPATQTMATAKEMWSMGESSDGNDVVQVGRKAHAVIAYENNGWTGVDVSVIQHIAAPISVSLYRSVNAHTQFIYARNGTVVRVFDPVLYNPEGAIAEELALNFAHSSDASVFELLEVLTGIVIERAWLLEERRCAYRRAV